MKPPRRSPLLPLCLLCVAAALMARGPQAAQAALIGDFFDLSVENTVQGVPRTDPPLEVIFGQETGYVALTQTEQLIVTRDPNDPQIAVRLVQVDSGPGQRRDFAIQVDFREMIQNLPLLGFPVDQFVAGTTIWFDDLESLDATGGPELGTVLHRVILTGSSGANGVIEFGDPLKFADGNGLSAPMPSDTDGTGLGEVLALLLPNGAGVENYPIVRIEFNVAPEPGAVSFLVLGALGLLGRRRVDPPVNRSPLRARVTPFQDSIAENG